jgi:hypothetical protein
MNTRGLSWRNLSSKARNLSALSDRYDLSRCSRASDLCIECHYHASTRLPIVSQQSRTWLDSQSFVH